MQLVGHEKFAGRNLEHEMVQTQPRLRRIPRSREPSKLELQNLIRQSIMLRIVQPQRDFTSARSFIEALLPINWSTDFSQTWLFRGQPADHPLVPSLFRDDCKKIRSLVKKEIGPNYDIKLAERDVLTRFFEIADQRGLVLPDDSQQLRTDIEDFKSSDGEGNVARGFRGWNMSDRLLSLMALAQHYGIPTRLLDWSRLPLAAAYFAGEGAARRYRTDPQSLHPILVVWALFFPPSGKHGRISRSNAPLSVITAPSATNQNLKAQQGVFTLARPNFMNINIKNRLGADQLQALPLEDLLMELGKDTHPDLSDLDSEIVGCQLQKLSLPITEAEELLRLLAQMGVTHSSIYPGYASILTDIENESRWANHIL